jgi:hypothetical protein
MVYRLLSWSFARGVSGPIPSPRSSNGVLFFKEATVDQAVLTKLMVADDPEACEMPRQINWASLLGRVGALKPVCDKIAGRGFELDDGVQDASYFADIALHSWNGRMAGTVFGLRFSCFGDLFTTLEAGDGDRLSLAVISRLIEAAEQLGFSYVPPEALHESYTGVNPVFTGQTWWHRFFEHL